MSTRIVLLFSMAIVTAKLFAAEKVSFSREIRPLFSENCFFCHGPDAGHREGDLRLDQEVEARKVFVPGDASGSSIMQRLQSKDADEVMPPPSSHRHLTREQIDLIARWIDTGAEWGEHWSFAPLHSPPVPLVDSQRKFDFATPQNPIDAFVQHRLLLTGELQPNEIADRNTLIRRLSLDLTGLPPTPDEVDRYINDQRPNAYEVLVDRLLASPAYGQRMAWDWLDAARYADSNGYQGDNDRTMWPWRDWVIHSLNEAMPFDQFTIWQLAGDLLTDVPDEAKLATGFLRNHMINGEGGRIAEENRVDYVMDMAETTATVWLGLTLNCCRCHDHKYDPLTQKNYYQLNAFFNQTPVNGDGGNPQTPPTMDWLSETQKNDIEFQQSAVNEYREKIKKREEVLAKQQMAWEADEIAKPNDSNSWHVLRPTKFEAEHQTLSQLDDGSTLATGDNAKNDTYTLTYVPDLPKVAVFRLEALRHETMTTGALARSDSGNFVLTEFEVEVVRGETPLPEKLPIASAEATFEQGGFRVATAFDGNPLTGWAIYDGRKIEREHAAIFRLTNAVEISPGTQLRVRLRHDSAHASHNIGRLRISVSSNDKATLIDSRQDLLNAIQVATGDRTEAQAKLIVAAYRNSDSQYVELSKSLTAAEERLTSLRNSVPKVMVMQDLAEPRKTFVLSRGLYNEPGDVVEASVPESLPGLNAEAPRNRLGLAQWLVAKQQPLTARVTVNRLWQQLFGRGLVKTVEDFGAQSEFPLHGELLDFLAAKLRDSQWDTKSLVRLIVTSHVYQQSSHVTPQTLAIDPENRLLARASRYRLPAWMLRDQALAASGLLVNQFAGPSINVYQPAGVWEEATFGNRKYASDHGSALYRRSVYVFWRRIVAPTMFFDNASRQTCTVNAMRTNTPLHALSTLNDTTYVEAARVLASQCLSQQESDNESRLNFIYLRVLARSPLPAEQRSLLEGLERSRQRYASAPDDANRLLTAGEFKIPSSHDPVELASWTSLCLAIFNLDETLTKE